MAEADLSMSGMQFVTDSESDDQEGDDSMRSADGEEPEHHNQFEMNMSVSELVAFLKNKNIPDQYCEKFRDNYIDGTEFVNLTEEDVKSIVPPIGLVNKITRLINEISKRSTSTETSTPKLLVSPEKHQLPQSTPVSASSSVLAVTPSRPPCYDVNVPIHWRPEVEECIKNKAFTSSARNEIVRVLVSSLMAVSPKPSRIACEKLAQKFVLQYPFAKDDMGNGYQSWSDKMIERIRNIIKRDRKKGKQPSEEEIEKPTKRRMKESVMLKRYPVSVSVTSVEMANTETLAQHNNAIQSELQKSKPRDTVLLPLMKATYQNRRMYILNEAISVEGIRLKYPAISRPAVIQQELGLIIGNSSVKDNFITRWNTIYVPAIIAYAEDSKKSIPSLDITDETSKQIAAMKVLSKLLCKDKDALCYLYEEYPAITSVESACKQAPKRNQPRIGVFLSNTSSTVEYTIICEQKVLCKVANFSMALFIMFASYYSFNLEYPGSCKLVLNYLQDYILEQPDSSKKSASYLAIVSDIKRHI